MNNHCNIIFLYVHNLFKFLLALLASSSLPRNFLMKLITNTFMQMASQNKMDNVTNNYTYSSVNHIK